RVWLCRQRPASPLLQALLLMRRHHLRRRFRPRKTGCFRWCITRSQLEQRTKIGSCASPGQQRRRSRRDLFNAHFVTKNLKNSCRAALSQTNEASGNPAENRLIFVVAVVADRGNSLKILERRSICSA